MLKLIAGPVIGAVIGYCTNYLAVKMLFFPKREIRIGGYKLPFTPGAIPKGKPRLAKAVGTIVANDLLTQEDIKKKVLSEETENGIVNQIMTVLSRDIKSVIIDAGSSAEQYDDVKIKIVNTLSNQIIDSIHHMNLEELIVSEAGRIVKEKMSGSMLGMFVNEGMINSIIQPIGREFVAYIDNNGADIIEAEIEYKINSLQEQSVAGICQSMDISEDNIRGIVQKLYRRVADSLTEKLIGNLDITGMIEEKINAMDVDSLENLVLTVMKKELDMIVNLGALVGGVLGILTLLF